MEQSYFQQRMQDLGVDAQTNSCKVSNPDAEFPMPSVKEMEVFSEDEAGNIEILITRLDGQLINYDHVGDGKTSHLNGKIKHYSIKRLRQPIGDMKYQMPKGRGTYPFFPTEVKEAYKNQTPIDTLFLTEGVFKAWKGAQLGAMVIGLTSITHYCGTGTKKLHPDIAQLIETCQVKNVVVLWDADCCNISMKKLRDQEDLRERPYGFFQAAKSIRDLVRKLEIPIVPKVHFAHIKSNSLPNSPKGLDDLLIQAEKEDKIKEVTRCLSVTPMGENTYFYSTDISQATEVLVQYMGLKDVHQFYMLHAQYIHLEPFKFGNSGYQYNETENKVIVLSPEWAEHIYWIGDEFFKVIDEPCIDGTNQRKLIKRDKTTLKDLYGRDFIKYLTHMEGFTNVPNHRNHQQIITTNNNQQFYNRYRPIYHVAAEGACDKILQLIQHIFGNDEVVHKDKIYNSYELGLDYMQLLYQNPQQKLPVLCLYSPENNTGKSTFAALLRAIFKDNTIQVSSDTFQSEFGLDVYADKLVTICEETQLNQRKDIDRIKMLSTAYEVSVNPKGQKAYNLEFFSKFIFNSNNKNMLHISPEDDRFWVLRIPVITNKNPNFLQEMEAQIPAFLHFLEQRTLSCNNENRMWFNPILLKNKALAEMIEVSEPADAIELRHQIAEYFIQFNLEEARLPTPIVIELFMSKSTPHSRVAELFKDYLHVERCKNKLGKDTTHRAVYYKRVPARDNIGSFEDKSCSTDPCRCWHLKREQFVTPEYELGIEDEYENAANEGLSEAEIAPQIEADEQ